jgi:hypothetical protein
MKKKGPKALCFEEKSFWTKIQKIQSFIYFGCSYEKSMVEGKRFLLKAKMQDLKCQKLGNLITYATPFKS